MARAGLGLNRIDLAQRARISSTTLADFETGRREPYERTLRDIRTVLEDLGAKFIECDGFGAGVRCPDEQ
ncbi:helix-turn-helix domain-containing protein [Brucella sp. MAB-22]|uniref:helix-turn-helix domain-containing protein n=1 Tax=Brucella sp. MAB-22 TaxID=2986424 RepID=UPI00221F760D|nr:helix-turn-helix domain-containing protein [Brucella sp. MAB-22]UYT55535.1 helix-turn-helix domain-containing protein [Brucella sp. MAB-22]